jgi:hypothetical protein
MLIRIGDRQMFLCRASSVMAAAAVAATAAAMPATAATAWA